jgi:threonine/homoserine/homoserine lactone efflux protein
MWQLLGMFFIISLSGALSPGPLTTMSIGAGSRNDRWAGWWLSAGHGLIEGILVALIAFGLGIWLKSKPVTIAVCLVGGVFLAWMGLNLFIPAIKNKTRIADESAKNASRPPFSWFLIGGVMTLSNPYWLIWWVSVGATFIFAAYAWGITGLVLVFLAHWLTDLCWLTGLSFLTGSGHRWLTDQVYRWILAVCGLLLMIFSLYFIYSGINLILGTITL